MIAASIPANFSIPFANSAGAGYIRAIPIASQISTTPGAASLTDGFPPLNFLPVSAGGVPPFGQDVNGLLNQITANIQWENAGGTFPYNSAFSTAIGGYPAGALLRRTDGAGYWFSTTDNNLTNPDAGGAGWLGIFAGSPGASRVQGLVGNNNVTTPNSQFDFSALSVTVRNPTTGSTAVVANTGTITNNLLTAGPAANGRDQSATFAAPLWIYYYFIWNGTALATISSQQPPSTGPTLPTGYTSWAYIGTVRYASGSALVPGHFVGSWYNSSSQLTAISNGSATTNTAVSISSFVPPNALQFKLNVLAMSVTNTGSGAYGLTCYIQVETGQDAAQLGFQGNGTASASTGLAGSNWLLTNLSQSFNYRLVILAGTTQQVTAAVTGYSNPNGGE